MVISKPTGNNGIAINLTVNPTADIANLQGRVSVGTGKNSYVLFVDKDSNLRFDRLDSLDHEYG
ncbi:MAG: hypothetical protein LBF97_02905, partial [Elusimicrobiota bacterium]|nr:hypothetical protein [Elusimicrobiota bacterium]